MAQIYDFIFTTSGSVNATLETLLPLWNWSGSATSGNERLLYVDSAKTFGIKITAYGNIFSMFKNSSDYHSTSNDSFKTAYVKIEKNDNYFIMSVTSSSEAISGAVATNCDKFIICNGINTVTNSAEQILIYVGSKSSSNTCMMIASDVVIPVDLSIQNAGANVNAKTTNLIPFYNTASECISTDVYQSLCEDIGAWYFGNVIINNLHYRMSGSVFALDE